jgi:hypothetical protein
VWIGHPIRVQGNDNGGFRCHAAAAHMVDYEGWLLPVRFGAEKLAMRADPTLDYQYIANRAYNRGRGPANVLAVRIYGQY